MVVVDSEAVTSCGREMFGSPSSYEWLLLLSLLLLASGHVESEVMSDMMFMGCVDDDCASSLTTLLTMMINLYISFVV